VKQCGETAPLFVNNVEFGLDPLTDFATRARKRLLNPAFQLRALIVAEPTGRSLIVKIGQTIDPMRPIEPIPFPDCIAVHKQDARNCIACHAIVQ
jgi:hypothetical protein